MSRKFEVTWSMFGSASVDADSMDEAERLLQDELIHWTGFGLDAEDVMVDGVDIT